MGEYCPGDFAWDNPERALEKVEDLSILFKLHRGIWDEDLVAKPFLFLYQKVLHPRERQVVDFKIRGMNDSRIAAKLGIKASTVQRLIYNIRYVYRNKCRDRVYKSWWKTKDRSNSKDCQSS